MMKRIIGLILLVSSFASNANAQYWDWVVDAKKSAAFVENYGTQMVKLGEWLALYKLIEEEQKQIAEKATFIHMVRDSLFKSMQDVHDILNQDDQKNVELAFDNLSEYFNRIKTKTDDDTDLQDIWIQYENFVVKHSADLLAMAAMATGGGDEKNLLDKQQRLALLNYVISSLRYLKAYSRSLHDRLEVASHHETVRNAIYNRR
jgi:uncharacterized phage infection (PIP) family protein YhgE